MAGRMVWLCGCTEGRQNGKVFVVKLGSGLGKSGYMCVNACMREQGVVADVHNILLFSCGDAPVVNEHASKCKSTTAHEGHGYTDET